MAVAAAAGKWCSSPHSVQRSSVQFAVSGLSLHTSVLVLRRDGQLFFFSYLLERCKLRVLWCFTSCVAAVKQPFLLKAFPAVARMLHLKYGSIAIVKYI